MKFKEALGIDVSKKKIDAVLYLNGIHDQFDNTVKGYKNLIRWAEKNSNLSIISVLVCFEHTGLYSFPLAVFFHKSDIRFSMVPALEIKRSLGIVRGKNDKIDARRIAEYAWLRRETLKPFNLPSNNILKLQKLLVLRQKMVRQKADYSSGLKEYKAMLKQKDYEPLFSVYKKMAHYLDNQIKVLEKEIIDLIKLNEEMKRLYDLIISIKGIGLIIAANFLVVTNCFTNFENSRKFACYSGIAPFAKESGISLKTRSRVSHFANKNMKSLLNLAASSAIQADPELKAYYQRRLKAGKSKMSTLNIVRNKIVFRVFAVVKRGTPYIILHKHAG
jgi:transposase